MTKKINLYQSKKPIPQKSEVSTARFQSEKNLPYGAFFLQPNFFGLNTFYMALQIIYMAEYMYLIIKKVKKLIKRVFWITIIANFLQK